MMCSRKIVQKKKYIAVAEYHLSLVVRSERHLVPTTDKNSLTNLFSGIITKAHGSLNYS